MGSALHIYQGTLAGESCFVFSSLIELTEPTGFIAICPTHISGAFSNILCCVLLRGIWHNPPFFQLTEPSHLLCSHPATGIAQQKGLQFWGEIWDENQIKFSMSTGFSPPESSSLSISSSSQMVSSTEQPMGERAAAMTTVVEHQGNASRSHSRQPSRESSRSSSERKGV